MRVHFMETNMFPFNGMGMANWIIAGGALIQDRTAYQGNVPAGLANTRTRCLSRTPWQTRSQLRLGSGTPERRGEGDGIG